MSNTPIASGEKVGPFMGVQPQYDRQVTPIGSAESFRVVIYAAYNAFGLIAPERNGLAVLNETRRNVFCDEIEKASSGYFGPSKRQVEAFEKLTSPEITLAEFISFMPKDRLRYEDIEQVKVKNTESRAGQARPRSH